MSAWRLVATWAVSALACAGLISCDRIFGTSCTLLPCGPSLTVLVLGSQQAAYTVELSTPDGETRSAACIASSAESCEARFFGIHPEQVAVRVTWDANELRAQFSPSYERSYPNGKDCGPYCLSTTIEAQIDESGQTS